MYVRLQVGQRFILSRELFQPNLDTVSTTCGSGWVRSHAVTQSRWRIHPLPQVVLTVSKQR